MDEERQGVVGTVGLLAATVAVIFAVALRTADESGAPVAETTGSASALDAEALLELSIERTREVARRVEEIRGVRFGQIPEPQISDTDELRRLATEQLSKEKVAEEVLTSDAGLKILGLLDPEASLADVSEDVTASAAAYYDPKEGELFLVGDAVPAGPQLTEFVLSHELTHALEDQVFGLPVSNKLTDDEALAQTALVEGSATSLMTVYAAEHLSAIGLLAESSGLATDAELPPFAEAQVLFSYIEGRDFVDLLLETASGDWKLVDFAYERRLPASTEQILHPEKYLAGESPLPVTRPSGPGAGWKEVDSGTVGEFTTRLLLREGTDEERADAAAAGWGGDSYRLFRRTGGSGECTDDCLDAYTLAIAWRGDDAAEARELEAALGEWIEDALSGLQTVDRRAWELPGGYARLVREGDLLTLALGGEIGVVDRIAGAPIG